MTTDARRLMRPGAVASMEHSVVRLLAGTAKLPDLGSPRAGQRDSEENGCPYEGLSRFASVDTQPLSPSPRSSWTPCSPIKTTNTWKQWR